MGVMTLFILPDYPQTAKFLDQSERDVLSNRLSRDSPTKVSKTWNAAQVRQLFFDPTFWTFNFVWFCHAVGGFGLSYVLPTVIFQLGAHFLHVKITLLNVHRRLYLFGNEQRSLNATFFGGFRRSQYSWLAYSNEGLESILDCCGM